MILALSNWVGIDHQSKTVEIFGIRLVGLSLENAHKLLVTVIFIIALLSINWLVRKLIHAATRSHKGKRIAFWVEQAERLLFALILLIGLVSIWFNEPARFATFFGLVSAGLAFALQKVVTAFAGYFAILRGNTFNVGDRITMGGVRGDVIRLGFVQTTIMEMGQPPAVADQADPAMWVHSRQYTGRVVTVTNDKIFDTPVFNFTREFPFIWEELSIPVAYSQADKRAVAEQILLNAALELTVKFSELSEEAIVEMERRYVMKRAEIKPRVYWRLTDNWVEMTVRFICRTHGVRNLKDAMSRQIIAELDKEGIGIASSTYDVVGFPPVRVQLLPLSQDGHAQRQAANDNS